MKNYKLERNLKKKKKIKTIYENEQKNYTEIEKHKFHQHKSLILINNVYIDKIVAFNEVFLVKKNLNVLLVTRRVKNYSFMYISSKDACI